MDANDKPVTLRSNEFWGERSGIIHPTRGPIFPGRKGSTLAHQEHQGPHGKQLRFYPARAMRRKLGKHGLARMTKKA